MISLLQMIHYDFSSGRDGTVSIWDAKKMTVTKTLPVFEVILPSLISSTVKPVLSGHSKNRQNKDLNGKM